MNYTTCISKGLFETIYIYDEITYRDFEMIAFFSSIIPNNVRFPKVALNSDGGSVDAAIGIGRILRWKNASAVTRDLLQPENIPLCFSACVLIAAGAIERNLDIIGLHSGYTEKRIKKELYEKSALGKDTVERINSYYLEMGISPEITAIEARIPFDKMEYFTFRLDEPLERQIIYQLGFRMRGSDAEDVARIGKWMDTKKWSNGSLNQFAKNDDAEAQFKLGKAALDGRNGWGRNIDAALLWLNKAAGLNHVGALHLLGVVYSNGVDGIEADKSKAFGYYLKAAKLGYAGSQNNLAWAYYKGDGVSKNLYEAIYWATKATERGDYFSYGSLGAIRLETDVFVRDDIQTYMWLKLGTDLMPKGNSRDGDLRSLEKVKQRMTEEEIKQGDILAQQWKPLRESDSQMRDKDD